MNTFRSIFLLLIMTVLACGDQLVEFPLGAAPTVTSTQPESGAIDVATNTTIRAVFSTEMDAATLTAETFILKQNGATIAGALSYSGLTLTFAPTSILASGAPFTATITTGAADVAGNALAEPYVWGFATGSVEDTTPPTVTATVPADGTMGVDVDGALNAFFSEAMDCATLSAATVTLVQGAVPVATVVTCSGNKATITPSDPLAFDSAFTATITAGALDLAGNALAADYVWDFTTGASPDVTAPVVTFTVPGGGATGVTVNTSVNVAFSESMNCLTLSAATFTLMQGVTPVAATVTCSGNTATLTPVSALAVGAVLTATVTTGAEDLAGNGLAADYVWDFTTSSTPDTTAPIVLFTVPATDATGVSAGATVHVAFNESMNCLTLDPTSFTLMQGATPVLGTVVCSGSTATLTPALPLALGATFTATITTGARDLSGNALAAAYVWDFSTSDFPDIIAPVVTFTAPASGAASVSVNTKVQAAFSEAMNCLTLSTLTFTLKQGVTPILATVACSGNTATLTPLGALSLGVTYTATITTGAQDLAGNALAADYVWDFATGSFPDIISPIVTFTAPAAGATGVSVNTMVQAAFSESMNCLTLTTLTFTLKQGVTPVLATVTCSGSTATLTPLGALAVGATFTATITTGAQDLAGNPLVTDYVWDFATSSSPDVLAPVVTFTAPVDGATGVSLNTPVQVAFNESMNCLTLNAVTFTLFQGLTQVLGPVTCSGNTATLTPLAPLALGTTYVATVTTGAQDLSGNALAADYIWDFSTGNAPDALAPMVTFTDPANNDTGVDVNTTVQVAFSETMNCQTLTPLTFTLFNGLLPVPGMMTCNGQITVFTPTSPLLNSVAYTGTITTGAQDLAGNGLANDYVWTFLTGPVVGGGQPAVDLGVASSYAILAFNTVTNVNNVGTIVTGDLGISPGAALVGFPPGQVIGVLHLGDATAATAKAALLNAYNDAVGRLGAAVLPGDLSGLTLPPGLYKNSTSVMLSAGNLTLDALGDSNAAFIFQMGSTLTTMPGTQVILAGGAKATNVYWAVGTSATLGTTSSFKGTILAAAAITMNTGASIEGRLLAQSAAVDLDTNTITVPAP